MSRRALLTAAILFAAVVASRVPFATERLWAWDSVLYARALEQGFHVDVDLSEQRPHPPGYLLYVASAALARMVAGDSNAALVLISILASAGGAVALYALARRFARGSVALVAAAAYAASPLVWLYSEVAYPYTLLGALSVALAWLFHGRANTLVPSLVFGLLTGFRQDLLVLMCPLWLWSLWPHSPRRIAAGAAAVALGALPWLVPTVALSGGVSEYVDALRSQSAFVAVTYSVPAHGLQALGNNLVFTTYALVWGLGLAALAVLAGGVAVAVRWAQGARPPQDRPPQERFAGRFFLVWIGPALAFYVVVHIGEWGYVLSVLPGLYVLVAAGAERLVRATPPALVSWWRAAAIAVVLVPATLFVGGADRFSAAALARHDDALAARTTYVRDHFAPETTIVLAREDYLLVRYYLPEYRAWLYDPQPYQKLTAKRKRAMRSTAIVIFTEGLRPRQQLDVRTVEVAPGIDIAYAPIEPGTVLEFYGERYIVREGP